MAVVVFLIDYIVIYRREEEMMRLEAMFKSNKEGWWGDHKQTLWRDIR